MRRRGRRRRGGRRSSRRFNVCRVLVLHDHPALLGHRFRGFGGARLHQRHQECPRVGRRRAVEYRTCVGRRRSIKKARVAVLGHFAIKP